MPPDGSNLGGGARGYVICTAPRSGSNYLCQLLSSTGVLGHPLEYFNAPGRRRISDPTYPGNPKEQVARILRDGRTSNGIYGVKLFASQFREVSRKLKLTQVLPGLRFVTLRRRDVLGQAISWVWALQTEQYRSTQPAGREPVYDRRAIARQLKDILEEHRLWAGYFARTGQSPVSLVYEDLIQDPQAEINRVAAAFGVAAAIDAGAIDLKMQRGSVHDEWRHRFIAETGDPDKL